MEHSVTLEEGLETTQAAPCPWLSLGGSPEPLSSCTIHRSPWMLTDLPKTVRSFAKVTGLKPPSLDYSPNETVLLHFVVKPYRSHCGDLVVSQSGEGGSNDRCAELRERTGSGQGHNSAMPVTLGSTPQAPPQSTPSGWAPPAGGHSLPPRRKQTGLQSYSGRLTPDGMCPTRHSLMMACALHGTP